MLRLLLDFLKRPIAHHTLHDISCQQAENSFEGAEAAIAAGYPIEIDLQLSADGMAMVFHDYTLDRLTEFSGALKAWNSDELVKTALRHGQSCIARFVDFLHFIDGRVPILVELKTQNQSLHNESDALVNAVASAVEGYDGALAFMSFNPALMMHCATILPQYPRGLITDAFMPTKWAQVSPTRLTALAQIVDYDAVGACFISHNIAHLKQDSVRKIVRKGGSILCWTVQSAVQQHAVQKLVDNITFEGYKPII